MPTNWPDLISKLILDKVSFSALEEYLKPTFLKLTEPSLISKIGFSGFLIVESSSNTSAIRLIDSIDIASITIIIEIIINDINICTP